MINFLKMNIFLNLLIHMIMIVDQKNLNQYKNLDILFMESLKY